MTDEEAKAVQESAKAANNALTLSREFGGFLNSVFGGLVEDSVGLVADKLRFYRLERFYILRDKTISKLETRGVECPDPVQPKFAVPLFESATVEADDELLEMWSNLLSNAMDPNFEQKPSTSFISVLRDCGPLEALILKTLYEAEQIVKHSPEKREECRPRSPWFRQKMGDNRPVPPQQSFLDPPHNEWIAWENLERLGCVKGVHETSAKAGGELTAFGQELVRACSELS